MAKKPRSRARYFTRADGLVPIDLIDCGLDHVDAALALFDLKQSLYDSAGYLAHIGVELMLKGWLLEVADRFEGTHKLEAHYQELVDHHGAPQLDAAELRTIQILDSYERLRYPNRNAPTEVGSDDRPLIEALRTRLCRSMPRPLQEGMGARDPIRKAGRVLMRRRIDRP